MVTFKFSIIAELESVAAVGCSALLANQLSPRRGNDVSNKAAQLVEYEQFISCFLRAVT
jgi:hypothetical protein